MGVRLSNGYKGGLFTFLSLLLSQNQSPQNANLFYGIGGGHNHHGGGFTPSETCLTYNGKQGICQTLVECARHNDRPGFLRHSLCQLTQFTKGICCPDEDEEEEKTDPIDYPGLADKNEKNISIEFPQGPAISTEALNNACEIAILQMNERQKFERDLGVMWNDTSLFWPNHRFIFQTSDQLPSERVVLLKSVVTPKERKTLGEQYSGQSRSICDTVVRRNIVALKGTSIFWHAQLFKTTEKIFLISIDATTVLLASSSLIKRFSIGKDEAYTTLTTYTVENTILQDTCPETPPCNDNQNRYRSYDGTCNNLLHRYWGSVGTYLRRLMPPSYQDGVSIPRLARSGRFLPSARFLSMTLHPEKPKHYTNYTLLLMQWGQFLDHDITLTPLSKGPAFADVSCCEGGIYRRTKDTHPECLPIEIPDDDPFYSNYGQKCMEFIRSMPAIRPQCSFGPREQMNQITSYIDGSCIYGSTEEYATSLRTFKGGELRVSKWRGHDMLPHNPNECATSDGEKFCFKAGDVRANEQPHLAAMHTVWIRVHNYIVKKLARLNRHWSDETLYQEGRRIVAAQIQHITYNEFLPIVLGRKFMTVYKLLPKKRRYFKGYRDDVDATILNSFTTSAYRFGHTLITDHFRLYARNGKKTDELPINDVQFAPFALYERGGFESLLRGLIRQRPRRFDRFFAEELTQKLFAGGRPFGLDLVAFNIQRGRDHGLPPYVEWRKYCGLKPANTWDDLLVDMSKKTVSELQAAYEDIEDIDLYVGGVSEVPLNDTLVGPTFLCILAKQFIRLKLGDRFFYENAPDSQYSRDITAFTRAQLNQIRKTSLARIFCIASRNIGSIQPMAFITSNSMNERVPCNARSKIPYFNLHPWKMKMSRMNMTNSSD